MNANNCKNLLARRLVYAIFYPFFYFHCQMPGLVWSLQEIQALLRWIAENNRQTTWNRQDSLRGVQNALIPYNPVYFHGTSGIQRIRSKLVNLYKAYVNCYEAVTPIGASRSSTCGKYKLLSSVCFPVILTKSRHTSQSTKSQSISLVSSLSASIWTSLSVAHHTCLAQPICYWTW